MEITAKWLDEQITEFEKRKKMHLENKDMHLANANACTGAIAVLKGVKEQLAAEKPKDEEPVLEAVPVASLRRGKHEEIGGA